MCKVWTTQQGEEILISEMTDSHLLNTIKFLKRRSKEEHEVCSCGGYDGDDDFMTGYCDYIAGKEWLDTTPYNDLMKEKNKRFILTK